MLPLLLQVKKGPLTDRMSSLPLNVARRDSSSLLKLASLVDDLQVFTNKPHSEYILIESAHASFVE